VRLYLTTLPQKKFKVQYVNQDLHINIQNPDTALYTNCW